MAEAMTDDSRRCLMLGVGGEIFAIDAERVHEILDPAPVTEAPGARDFVRGLINVRCKVVPMADLRPRFGMEVEPATADTRFVVLEVDLDGESPTRSMRSPSCRSRRSAPRRASACAGGQNS